MDGNGGTLTGGVLTEVFFELEAETEIDPLVKEGAKE
jgi:hypothetical protein